jgi:hypothetical protein
MRVVALGDPSTDQRWDPFVRAHPRATPYHLAAWAQVLATAYRLEPVYLALEDDEDQIHGVFPIMRSHGIITGTRLNSLPELQWGGPLAATTEDEFRLVAAACRLVESGKAKRFLMRSTQAGYEPSVPGLAWRPAPPTWQVELGPDFESFRKRLKAHSKNAFRSLGKAEAAGITVRAATSEADLKRFYRLYLETMRKHRSIPRAYRQFVISWRLLAPQGVMQLLLAEREGRLLAGGVFNRLGDTVDLMYNASDARYLDLRPNHAIYADAIRRAIESGYQHLDLGGAKPGSSLAGFKQQWCADPVPLFTYALHVGATEGTAKRALQVKSRVRTDDSWSLTKAWERIPLLVTRVAGRLIYRYF